ncbi:ankyrin repeat and SOCS box protein 18-like [Papaver somniferum]|uniref:ankyrin repeat and SOCS box protein 18-like n=1 Tax=Papaver somniferum TaxID=3469 RepID=UPI000E701C6D|nr:ankyrin repeat and SOCS box protein 18-like [Papaver somniferum]
MQPALFFELELVRAKESFAYRRPNLFFNEVITPLVAAIRSKSWQCVEHLLKAGVDPNGGPGGVKALPFAAEVGIIQIIKLLVKAGADPNVTDIVSYRYFVSVFTYWT